MVQVQAADKGSTGGTTTFHGERVEFVFADGKGEMPAALAEHLRRSGGVLAD